MSEQTSPLHDPSSAAPAQAPARSLPQLRLDVSSLDWPRIITVATIVGILVLAGFLRFTHTNWDSPGGHSNSGHLHPDERFLAQIQNDTRFPSSPLNYFDTDTSRLNPYNIDRGGGQRQTTFVYGTLPLFLNKTIAEWLDEDLRTNADGSPEYTSPWSAKIVRAGISALGFDIERDGGRLVFDGGYEGHLVGRVLSGIFDLGTILLIFFIGRRLMNKNVGILAAFLYAVSPFPIQNSHFFIVDPYVTFFATATVLFAIRSAQDGGYRNFAFAGACAGLAAACKITAVSLLPVAMLAVAIYAWPGIKPFVAGWWTGDSRPYETRQDGHALDRSVLTFVLGSLVVLLAGFIAFRIAMPYAFRSPDIAQFFDLRLGHMWKFPVIYPDIMNQQWIKDQVDQQHLLGGAAFPPNVQWIGRSKWIWPAQQMIAWGMGPALGIVAWLGVVFAAIYAIRKRQGVWLVPLAWVLGYFGFMGAQYSLYMRYFLPLYPILTVLAAVLLFKTAEWGASKDPFAALGRLGSRLAPAKPLLPYATRASVTAVAVMTLLAGFAFYNVYRHDVTRVEASRWFFQNVPDGAVIGHEHWDDQVPYNVPGVEARQYEHLTFNNYETDTPDKVDELLANIEAVDYIALSSARLSGTIPRVPATWPITSRYYAALESGDLGFRKVAEFTSYPEVFGMTFNDTGAEESFSVYDHPKVSVYMKTDDYSPEKARAVLGADAFIPGFNMLPSAAGTNAVQYRPEVLAEEKAGGTWSAIFHPGSIINDHPLFFWLLTVEVAAFALAPLAFTLFAGLPDRGYLLTKPLGIFALAYLAYAPAAFANVDYTRGEIAAALGVMVAVGAATAYLWRASLLEWIRQRWRFILFAEAFFIGVFVLTYWIRIQNPDLWHPARGGEKPMDLAYLTAVIKTTDLTQGAIDPWNAGGYLNYYYYGQFIAATVTKLTGIVPEVAYNLIVPMFWAVAAAATFSVTYNLAEATRRLMRRRPGGLPIGATGPILAGLLGVFLVLFSGNLKAVGVLESNLSRLSPWESSVPVFGGILAIVGGFKEIIFGDASFRQVVYSYDWWDPSRALDVQAQGEVTPITEFPFWTFLFADLHAHLMAIPFSMTAVGVGLAAVLNFTRLNDAAAGARSLLRRREVASWVMVVLIALIVGALRWINSWDYPPFLLMGAAALIIGERARDGRFMLRTLCVGALKAAVMAVLSYLFFAPFAKNYDMFYSGFSQSQQTTALSDYFSHFGVLLLLMSGFLVFALNRVITRNHAARRLFFGSARRRQPVETAPVMVSFAVAAALLIWAATVQRWGVIALSAVGLATVLLIAWRELRSPSPMAPVLLFVYAMAALGFGLSGGVEMLTLDGDIGRMNTVFKFYLHVWMVWGVVGAFGTWYLFGVMRPQDAFLRRASALDATLVRLPRYAFAALVAVFLAAALVFPYFGSRARFHDRFDPSLGATSNGMAYMDEAVYQDYDDRTQRGGENILRYEKDAIHWLRANVKGSPTTIEGVTPFYHWGSRMSIYTGLPTVSGWDWHQSQQRARFGAAVQARQSDVNEFYATEDVSRARDLLKKYDVEWVILGSVEHNYYPDEGLAKFANGLDGRLELAYANPGVQIFHVIPEGQLEQASAAR